MCYRGNKLWVLVRVSAIKIIRTQTGTHVLLCALIHGYRCLISLPLYMNLGKTIPGRKAYYR